jgi:hypothetical protein
VLHEFVNVWLPGFLTGAAISALVTWVVLRGRRPKAPRLRIDRPRQRVDIAMFGAAWTGIVERVDYDSIREEVRLDLISPKAFEERYRLPQEGFSP